MDDTTTPKRRGRPKGARPARTSAQKMREARERIQAALNAPGSDVGTLPDSLLLEALAVAYRKGYGFDFWFAVQALTERLNKKLPADQRLYLTREWGADRDTVTAIEADSQTAGESRHSDQNTNGIADTVTHIDNGTVTETDSDTVTRYAPEPVADTVTDIVTDTVTAMPEPFTLAPAAPAKPVSERDARILALAASGMGKRTIGTTLGIPESTVRWVIKQHGQHKESDHDSR